MKIVLGYPAEPEHLRRIQAVCPTATLVRVEQDALSEQLLDCDVFCGHAKVPVEWDEVVRRGRLRWIQSSAAGLDHCLVPAIIHSSVIVSSASGVFADSVAEQTAALLLGLVRRLHVFSESWRRREFVRQPTDDLKGKTVCLMGLGGNGSRIAHILRPFGVRILATDHFPLPHPAVDAVRTPEVLDEFLPQSNVLVVTVPLTPATHDRIGARELALLPPRSYLINVARGRVLVESALVDALRSGHLAGAGLDVTYEEPPHADSPLWTARNLIVTPHVGAQSAERLGLTTDLFCINLQRFLHDRALLNVVDKSLGFPHPDDRWHPQ